MMRTPRSNPSQRERILAARSPEAIKELLTEGLAFEDATDRTKAQMRKAARRRLKELEGG